MVLSINGVAVSAQAAASPASGDSSLDVADEHLASLAANETNSTGNVSAQDGDMPVEEDAVMRSGTPLIRETMEQNNKDLAVEDSNISASTVQRQQVGATIQFHTRDQSGAGFIQTSGVVEAVTPNAQIVVENGVASNPDVSQRDVERIAAAFNNSVHPTLNSSYGTQYDVDGDGRVTIYLMDIRIEGDPDNDGRIETYVGGYHDPEMYDNDAQGDQRDAIYIDTDETLDYGTFDELNTTLAQEYAHAIIYNYDGRRGNGEEMWLNEALANHAEYRVYNDKNPGRIQGFENNPDNTLTDFSSPNIDARYGASFLFANYLNEHYSGVIGDLVQDPDNGINSINQVLDDNGYNDDFDDVFRNWTVANRIDDDDVADAYGYSDFEVEVHESASGDTIPTTESGQTESDRVAAASADYWEVNATAGSLYNQLELSSGSDDVELVVVAERDDGDVVRTVVTNESSISAAERQRIQANISSEQISADSQNISANILPSVPPITENNTITDAQAYDDITVILANSAPSSGHDYQLTPQQVPADNRFSGTLTANETASYVIPVNKYGTPNVVNAYEHNGDVFASVWSTGAGNVSATLTDPDGENATKLRSIEGIESTTLVGENPLTESNVWRLDINGSTADAPFRVATTYAEGGLNSNQVFTLPSTVSVSQNDRNLQAGSNNSTQPIRFTVNISAAGQGYTYSPFAAPNASHFDVTVGNRPVDTSNVTLVQRTQGKYDLIVVPPEQPDNGQYDLGVSFTDQKFGVNGTATTTVNNAVSYSGSGASGSASVSLVIDRSGSMGGGKLSSAQSAANQFLDRFSGEDRVSIVSYESSSRVDYPMGLFGGNETSVRNNITSLNAGGGTNIYAGLEDGGDQLDASPNQTNQAVILLSDGVHNAYGTSEADIVTLAGRLSARGYCVYTVAFGSGADDQLLRDIADQSCGDFRDTTNSGTSIAGIYRDLSATTSGLSSLSTQNGSVSANNTTADSFSLDNTTGTSVVTVTLSSGSSSSNDLQTETSTIAGATATTDNVTVLLYYPNGTQVELNSSTSSGTENPNIIYTTTGNTQTYQINDPRPGEWTYEIDNDGTNNTSYQADVSGSTQTTMTVVTDSQTYVNGSDAELSAVLVGPKGGVSGATANATVTAPDGSTRTVTLTESSAGQYTGSVTLSQTGEYTADISASKGNTTREESITWTTINESSLLNVSEPGTKEVTESTQTEVELTIERPSSPTASTTAQQSVGDNFDSAAREIATMSVEEIRNANVSEDVRQAALRIHNQSRDDNTTVQPVQAAQTGSGGSSLGVYVQTGALTGQKGTIPAANVQPEIGTLGLTPGESTNLSVTVQVPQGTPEGNYTGRVTLLVKGTQIESAIGVTVTSADADTYRAQLINTSAQWRAVPQKGQDYYEAQIADTVTNIYFATDTSESVGLRSGTSYWQGQTLSVSTGFGAAGDTYELYSVNNTTSGWQLDSAVQEIDINGLGSATINTSQLDGSYVVTDETGTPVRFDANGSTDGQTTVADARFAVREQSLSVDFNQTSVSQGNSTTVDLTSNRTDYTVTIAGGSLTVNELAGVFNQSDADSEQAGYQLDVSSASATLTANFTAVPANGYAFEFSVVDSTAATSGTVTVTATSPSPSQARAETEVGA